MLQNSLLKQNGTAAPFWKLFILWLFTVHSNPVLTRPAAISSFNWHKDFAKVLIMCLKVPEMLVRNRVSKFSTSSPNTHFSCCFPLIIVPQGLAFVWSNLLIFKLNVSCSFCPGMASVLREPGTAASLFPNSRAFVCGQSDVIYYMHSWADSRYGCKLGEL